MPQNTAAKLPNALGLWVAFVCKKAAATVLLAAFLTSALLYYAITTIGISTDTTDMLAPDLPFRQNATALSQAFPQFSDTIVAVIDGPNADLVQTAADQFAAQLRRQPNLYGEVFDPAGLAFFQTNGLLYLNTDQLADLADRLIAAQPFLGTLWKEPTLPGLFDLLSLLLKQGDNQKRLEEAAPLLNQVTAVITAQGNNETQSLSWQAALSAENNPLNSRVIVIQPHTDFASMQPGHDAIAGLRAIARQLQLAGKFGARLRLTGAIPLAEEELSSVVDGLGLAGLLSLLLVLALLFWGLKSVRLVVAALITLLCGLVWTAAFAAFAVGTLNLISIAFAVLFIGLSVDFGIHFILRYLESDDETARALSGAARHIAGALSLSTIAAAIGFFAFLPTDYSGLAELGLIAGGGMFIAVFANLTLLPALISLLPPPPSPRPKAPGPTLPSNRPHRLILGTAALLAALSMFLAPAVLFDFDPLNLKDSKTESVSTFFDLMASGSADPYAITVLAKDLATADKLAAAAKKLPLVDNARTLSSLVATHQADKLALIEDMALILGPALSGAAGSTKSTHAQRLQAARQLHHEIRAGGNGLNQSPAVQKLGAALNKFLATSNPALAELEKRLLGSLPQQISRLKHSLNAEEITVQAIPAALKSRQTSTDGKARVEITPQGNMRNRAELAAFVASVRTLAPAATGTAVIIIEAGRTIVRAFIEAATLTFVLIVILVIMITRNIREIVLIFTPLLLAALFTLAASVLLTLPFNFANVIVLPLLFGLGIAGAIHLVMRDRRDDQDVMATSTPRAIVFSALTTIASFGSIALSSHPGTASMGVLLTIAIVLSLICTLIVLPALLAVWPQKRRQ